MTVSELRTLVDNLEEYIHVPDGIDRLRKMVLHLAVSGQLVPQDPSEGTGQELYRRIQAEKAETAKLKRNKAATEISDDEARISIPDTWEWVRVGEIASINSGTSYSKNDLDPSGIRILRGGNVVDNGSLTIKDDDVFVSSALRDEGRKVFKGDVVIVASTGSMSAIGKPSIVNNDIDAYIGAFLRIIRSHHFVDKGYFWIYIQSDLYRGYIRSKVQGTNINNIKNAYITENIFPLPPVAEQKRIVAKLDSIFALIDQLAEVYKSEQAERSKLVASSLGQLAKSEDGVEGNLALTHLSEVIRTKADAKVLRQTILHLAVSGQLVPQDPSEGTGEALYGQIKAQRAELIKQGKTKVQKQQQSIGEDEILFKIPDSWKWVRLIEVSDRLSAGGDKPKDFSKSKSGTNTIPVIANGETNKGIIGYTSEARICVPSVTVSGRGTIGYSEVRNYPYTPIVRLIVVEPCSNVDLRYLKFVFTSILEVGQGTSIPQLTVPMVSPKPIPLPPYAEQKRIVAKTTQLLDFVSELEKHLEK